MKRRELILPPTREGHTDFELMYVALRSIDPKQCTGEERSYVARCQRALNAVSEPVGELDELSPDVRMRKLKSDGGTVLLAVKDFDRLTKWIDTTHFNPALSIQVEDLKDRMTTAPVKDDESA